MKTVIIILSLCAGIVLVLASCICIRNRSSYKDAKEILPEALTRPPLTFRQTAGHATYCGSDSVYHYFRYNAVLGSESYKVLREKLFFADKFPYGSENHNPAFFNVKFDEENNRWYGYKQVSNMENMTENAKAIPENTLAVIQAEGREIYLMEIYRIPVELQRYPRDSWYGKARRHDQNREFVRVSFIEGDYPAGYTQQSYFLHIIGDKTFEMEVWLSHHSVFKNRELISQSGGGATNGQWENAGYSTDGSLWAKIVEYYMENANGKPQK